MKDINAISLVSKDINDYSKNVKHKFNLLAPGRRWKAFIMRYFRFSLMEKDLGWPEGQPIIFTWLKGLALFI